MENKTILDEDKVKRKQKIAEKIRNATLRIQEEERRLSEEAQD